MVSATGLAVEEGTPANGNATGVGQVALAAFPELPRPKEIVVKLRKGSRAAAALEAGRKDPEKANRRLEGDHELRALLDRHGIKSSDLVLGRAKRDEAAEAQRAKEGKETPRDKLFRWCRLELPLGSEPAEVVAAFKGNPAVECVEPVHDYRINDGTDPPITGLPDGTTDPRLPEQWHHTAVKSQATWNYLKQQGCPVGGRHDVVVAVIDTGVDYNHEDLTANIWTNPREIPGNNLDDDANGFKDDIHGCSVTSDSRSHSGDPIDLHGHGTHVAGIIAGTAFNLKGGVGVAFNVQVMAVRAAQYSGTLTTTDISEGVLYAIDNGAEVINMSFGGYQKSQLVEESLAMALHQAVLVAAAGNDNLNAWVKPSYPAALPFVHGVMATNTLGKKSWFSNYGYDMAAPGEGILSTLPNNQYAAWSGTSMAAPVVSGIAALMRSYWWQRDIYSSRFIMGGLSAACFDPIGRFGPVDAFKAVTELPQPGVELLDTWLFDDKGIDTTNDADGRIDAGEAVYLAIEAINRSGSAKNVVATLRARAEGAVSDDPYITFVTDTVNFGDIGPFNTADNGFIYNTSGVITGVEHPFVVQVSNDCPNDHVINFEITFTFLDGWDPNNTTPFTRVDRFTLTVQRGRNLPTVIASGQTVTLDASNLWIVGGPVLVEPGATLTIMPGTQVQWGAVSDDPYNPGPQVGNLVVRGNLQVLGTPDQPISLFPSQIVGGQAVSINITGVGDMRYCKVQTANIVGFRNIDHGYFYSDVYYGVIGALTITNSTFHRLRSGGTSAYLFDCCLFDSLWWNFPTNQEGGIPRISNCTFLPDNENGRVMSITPPASIETPFFGGVPVYTNRDHAAPSIERIGLGHAVPRNGFTYVTLPAEFSSQMQQAELIAQYFGGHITSIADGDEQAFLNNYLLSATISGAKAYFIGLTDEGSPGSYHWLDGSSLTYVNWQAGHPAASSLSSVAMVTIANQCGWGLNWPPPESSLGRWQSQTGAIGAYRSNAYYEWGPAFILKLPGTWTAEQLNAEVATGNVLNFVRPRMRGPMVNNAFLSKYWDPNVNTWMRVRAAGGDYSAMNFNYWGTTSETLIDHLIVDYYDNFSSAHVDYKPPAAHGYTTTYPFVEQVLINGVPADSVPKLGTERVDFTVTFNRDMDMTVEPFVTFGPSSPYTDFQVTARNEDFEPVASGWLNPRTWQGSAWITPMSGDGYHLMLISGAVAADDPWLVSGHDVGRFRFEVRSMEVAAMTLQANGEEGAIRLQWVQDDFELLAGYNLYRATSATGPWTKLNTTVIPPGSESYTDTAVSPAVSMYYKFTVVSTDFQESDFSNVAMAAAIDTVAPVLSHVPVTTAPPARGLRLTATATDNLRVTAVTVHYRPLGGSGAYTALEMANLTGDSWTGTVPGSAMVEPGIEYYLVVSDGISEAFSGTPVLPHQVTVSNVPTLSSVSPNRGPATGGTPVALGGILFEPGISVLFGGVLATNVQVLSANQLTCVTPPHFPALVDVKVVNPDNSQSTLLNAFRYEDTGVVVSLPNASGNYGAQVEVAVSASNLNGLRGSDLTVTWNPAVLSAVSARVGTLTAGWGIASNLGSAGRAVVSMASSSAVSGSGTLVILKFNVIGGPAASSPLVLEAVSLNDGAVEASRSDGLFTVNAFFNLAGTVRYFQGGGPVPETALNLAGVASFPTTTNAGGIFALSEVPIGGYVLTPSKTDGVAEITAYDASLVLQRAAGLIGLSADQTRAADVNRNGIVSAMDASYVLEKAVGLLEVPFPGAGKVWDFSPESRSYANLNANLTGQDFTAVLIGDVSGNWTPPTAPAPPVIQSGAVAYAFVHDPLNVPDPNTALLLVKTVQPALYGLDLTISFHPSLTLGQVRAGALGQNHWLMVNAQAPGSARIGAASALPVSGEGVLLELIFNGPPADLAVTSIRIDESQVSAVTDPGLDVFDLDHDGLINVLETGTYHSDPELADSDGDGRRDGEEVVAGTSPTNPGSFLRFDSLVTEADGRLRFTWHSVAGRTYRLQTSETLDGVVWRDLSEPIVATGEFTAVTVPRDPDAARAFYRLVVTSP